MGPLDQQTDPQKSTDQERGSQLNSPQKSEFSTAISHPMPVLKKNVWNINRGHIPSGSEAYQLVLREMTATKQCHSGTPKKGSGTRPNKSNIKVPGCDSPRGQVQWADKPRFHTNRHREQENPSINGV